MEGLEKSTGDFRRTLNTAFYVEIGDESGKNETFDATETIEKEGQKTIETGQNAIKVCASKP